MSDAAPPAALDLDGINKTFGGVRALTDVALRVMPATVHAIVGENGAGKSTLMAIAAGTLGADSGTVSIGGERTDSPKPKDMRARGLSIVYQEPALVPDLTVAENLRLAVAKELRPGWSRLNQWARDQIARWHPEQVLDPRTPVRDLAPDQRFIVEISKALAQEPRVLVLDEPTEHLSNRDVEILFATVRRIVANGCAVIYISHRVREVMEIADVITVLRDGRIRGTHRSADVSQKDIVDLIVGRELMQMYPPKPEPDSGRPELLVVDQLSGKGFAGISLALHSGEILGLAGIDGHGQREVLRALAGLHASSGHVSLAGQHINFRGGAPACWNAGIAFVPGDRHREGLMHSLTIRENAAVASLRRMSRIGFVRGPVERSAVSRMMTYLRVKAPSAETVVDDLSGGNQQKVVLARTLVSEPKVILADEPTQGVDVGARAEIYSILRNATTQGAGVILVAADASELAGICDRVLVFSSGRIAAELVGEEVTERNITGAALMAEQERSDGSAEPRQRGRLARLMDSDYAPCLAIVAAIVALGVVAASRNEFYLTTRNFSGMLLLLAGVAFVALAQQVVMLTGGIDLSVGPLAGLMVVVASFVLSDQTYRQIGDASWIILFTIALLIGVVNWVLIDIVQITPMIATLVTYTLVQAISLLLRPTPDGTIAYYVGDWISAKVGFVPVLAIIAVVLAIVLEYSLRRTTWGVAIRAVGSSPRAATSNGVPVRLVRLCAYVGCSAVAFCGGLALISQVGSGDAGAGLSYTLPSVTAVVLAGASLFGGRGTFVGAFLGALLLQQLDTVNAFLGLDEAWKNYLLGVLTLAAVGFYSKMRNRNA
ncbi:ATP-binding cassette domain-containing protein [Dactylosporangium sp. CA-233914]|uniref:ATP-binding cassette domain-containing protein n=1 Tax=Dactylosporangium sp. CA-233914 TaxID=3239934 RepID=UPI003D8B8733